MGRQRFTPEQIIAKLREADVLVGRGSTADEACRQIGIGVRAADNDWQAMLFVRNLTNKYYWNNVARLTDTVRRYAGEPRTFGIQLSKRF